MWSAFSLFFFFNSLFDSGIRSASLRIVIAIFHEHMMAVVQYC